MQETKDPLVRLTVFNPVLHPSSGDLVGRVVYIEACEPSPEPSILVC